MDNKITLKDTGEMVPAKDMYEIITNLEHELEITSKSHMFLTLLENSCVIDYGDIIQNTDNLKVVKDILIYKKQFINQDELKNAFINQCMRGNIEIVKLLITSGVNVHDCANQALCFAAEIRQHARIVKLLLEIGADVHTEDDYALRISVRYGLTEIVKLLLEHGANVHALNDEALRSAAQRGNTEIVELLNQYI